MIEFGASPPPKKCSKRLTSGVVQYLVGLLAIQEISDSDMLVFQVLVVLEEISDFINRVWGNIADVAECVGRIDARTRTRNQLGVVTLVIARFQTSENNALDVGTRHQLIVHENYDINWVPILAQRIGNKSVVEIVGEGGVKNAVAHEGISLLVIFIFDLGILGYLNENFDHFLFGIHMIYHNV
jgi:hypothetical protein